ncbi:unnamed protein product [Rhizophagus irregularis]|uniref:MIR domain-containing protein n=1 Tax=Rhizophagus irregularis TaxID=588596 RepID=A0A916EH46_9GLOM|nr:unnamed protein product [Rhizophagus irregularis]CAB5387831.1 unnamed protein product [Rhizophagus irregularis]
MPKFAVREWDELISGPISMGEQDQRVFAHADLPAVNDKLSMTLRLKIHNHRSSTEGLIRTPILQLTPNKSALHARFTGNWNSDVGVYEPDDGLLLNRWYHIAYTLSDPEKRLDVYIDGEWIGFYGISKIKVQKVIFNDGPLYIGRAHSSLGFNGEISNVRYFNWRLSPEEVIEDYFDESQKKPIVYGSKIALAHVSTGKYLSTKGIKYDLGRNDQQHYMAICDGQELDLKNDVWTIIGANGISIKEGDPVSLNNIIGFKHQATGCYLNSHGTNYGRVTPMSKQQQVTMCSDRDSNNDWVIRRYNSTTSYDVGHLMNGDIISLFHIRTNKPALYSNAILLGDGTQEVSCYGDGSENNNKWRIEIIN